MLLVDYIMQQVGIAYVHVVTTLHAGGQLVATLNQLAMGVK